MSGFFVFLSLMSLRLSKMWFKFRITAICLVTCKKTKHKGVLLKKILMEKNFISSNKYTYKLIIA